MCHPVLTLGLVGKWLKLSEVLLITELFLVTLFFWIMHSLERIAVWGWTFLCMKVPWPCFRETACWPRDVAMQGSQNFFPFACRWGAPPLFLSTFFPLLMTLADVGWLKALPNDNFWTPNCSFCLWIALPLAHFDPLGFCPSGCV